jgi:hypothetical protein
MLYYPPPTLVNFWTELKSQLADQGVSINEVSKLTSADGQFFLLPVDFQSVIGSGYYYKHPMTVNLYGGFVQTGEEDDYGDEYVRTGGSITSTEVIYSLAHNLVVVGRGWSAELALATSVANYNIATTGLTLPVAKPPEIRWQLKNGTFRPLNTPNYKIQRIHTEITVGQLATGGTGTYTHAAGLMYAIDIHPNLIDIHSKVVRPVNSL